MRRLTRLRAALLYWPAEGPGAAMAEYELVQIRGGCWARSRRPIWQLMLAGDTWPRVGLDLVAWACD